MLARVAILLALLLASQGCRRHSTSSTPDAGAGVLPPNTGASPQSSGSDAAVSTTFKSVDGGGTVKLAHTKTWPPCTMKAPSTPGVITLDDDGGVSPYDDTCLIDEQHGVFVDAAHGDDTTGDGSRQFPLSTIQAAIGNAIQSSKRVYACVGKYQGPVAIGTSASNGLSVYGGLSCDTWQPDTTGARTRVEVLSGGPALIVADTSDIEVARIDFAAMPGAPEPGTTYLAASVGNSHRVSLVDVALHAAAGEPGADGAAPAATPKPGAQGISGADACAGNPNLGASSVVNAACTMQSTVGGTGGDGATGTGNGGNGGFGAGGQGGLGETAAGWVCGAPGNGGGTGATGYMGYNGNAGSGAKGFGALVGGRFTGFTGQAGGAGGPGYGGSGGGGAKAPTSCSGLATATGASGGGGGAGGCGGKGGKGGAAGGSSIALVIVDSNVRLTGGSIAYGDGGKGGNGADGQDGGKGGAGGAGGQGVSGSHDACGGSAGGDGGKGGPGGGGNGGHSIGVLYLGRAPVLTGVAGEKDAANRKGGMPGQGPASITDMSMTMVMTGTAGISEFTHAM